MNGFTFFVYVCKIMNEKWVMLHMVHTTHFSENREIVHVTIK